MRYFRSNVRSREANSFSVNLYRYISMTHTAFMHLQNCQDRPRHFDLRILPCLETGSASWISTGWPTTIRDRFLRCKYPISRCANWRFTVIPIYEPTISACSCTSLLHRKVAYLSQVSLCEVNPIRKFHSVSQILERGYFVNQQMFWNYV